MSATKSYLICTTHRTGSTLLCQGLHRTKLCGIPDEYFLPHGRELAARHGAKVDSEMGYEAFLKALVDTTCTPNGVFGGKIMWNHLDTLCEGIAGDSGKPRAALSDSAWLEEAFPNLHYVWLRRNDLVLQAISSWKAKQTKIYHQDKFLDRETPAQDPVYDFEQIRKIRDRFATNNEHWRSFFEEHGISAHEVTYEEVCEDLPVAVSKILEFLGEPPVDFSTAQETTLERLADSTTMEWRERFLEEEQRA